MVRWSGIRIKNNYFMKVSDYLAEFIAKKLKTRHVFLITGGAIAPAVDALGRRRDKQGDIDYVVVQHEQAGAMAAETYSRFGPGPGVSMATSGPGATNFITGICGLWFDSLPGLFISGQVGSREAVDTIKTNPRQVGFQEADIVGMVKPITKYAVKLSKPEDIRYELEKATYIMNEGRMGPVLIDIPVDFQMSDIDVKKLKGFDPKKVKVKTTKVLSETQLNEKVTKTLGLISKAERPVILFGGGLKLGRAEKLAEEFAEKLGFPVVVSWSGFDAICHDHKQFVGHIGVYGNRGANFAVQNADLLISLGSRLDTRQTGGDQSSFAREAKKVIVDIDANEVFKNRGVKADVAVVANVKDFLEVFAKRLKEVEKKDISTWKKRCQIWQKQYPACLEEYSEESVLNAYVAAKAISDASKEGDVAIIDEGGNLVWGMQTWHVKKGQRVVSTFGNSPMGYGFPAALGAAVATGKRVILIDGDGGFQPNLQEMQTLKQYNLPVKIFLLNNRSMGIIKQFQKLYFGDRHYATEPAGGYSAPDFGAVARAYGIKEIRINNQKELKAKIKQAMDYKGPVLCDIWINEFQELNPKLVFGSPIEDMFPFLSDEEFYSNMIVKPMERKTKLSGWKNLNDKKK